MPSAQTLALVAVEWLMNDSVRAQRYLDFTGLDAEALRNGLTDNSVLGSVLEFLTNHEPDLIMAAEALAVTPEELVSAYQELAT